MLITVLSFSPSLEDVIIALFNTLCSSVELTTKPASPPTLVGMNEFVVTDRSFNKPLFEGDIVEVWSRRRQPTENICLYRDKPTSQYDIEVKARAVIRFKYGEWFLDYDNEYNNTLTCSNLPFFDTN